MLEASTRIVAVRHGETAWNVDTRIQGQLDIGLNERGRWQAQRVALALRDEPIAAIYASDLSRALETAQPTAAQKNLPLQPDPGLRERAFGAFEGKTFAQIEAEHPDDARRWRERDVHFRLGGHGESLLAFFERTVGAFRRLAAAHPGEQIAVFAHGGVMDMLYRAAANIPLAAPRTWQLGNTAINRVLFNGDGFSLVGWADAAHLQDSVLEEPG
jgi:2,3-bisphosphoglycerate-dependent phosphoglycerate mutase